MKSENRRNGGRFFRFHRHSGGDGEAALTRIVKNDAWKSRGNRLAADIQGVTGMDNQMTLEVS